MRCLGVDSSSEYTEFYHRPEDPVDGNVLRYRCV